jgi:PAS domain S-box-containing protein
MPRQERGPKNGECVLQLTPDRKPLLTRQDAPEWLRTFTSLHTWPYLAHVALLIALYVSSANLGLSLHAVGGFATAIWPPTGLALVALVLGGYRLWPGIALGAYLVNVWAGAPPLVASGMALGNTLEALVGAAFLGRVIRFRPALDRLRDVAGLVGAAALSTPVSATVGVTTGWLGGVMATDVYGEAWRTWWLGDMNGALVVAALLFTWSARPKTLLSARPFLEGAGLLLTVATLSLLVFTRSVATDSIDFSYLLFPVLVWAALRFGPPGASAATAIVSAVAIWGTAHGGGPFVGNTLHESVLALQAFMSIVAATVLVLAAVVAERKRAERRLMAHDATTRLLAEAATPNEVIPRAFQTICESLDWDMGALWHVDHEAQILRHGESWHRPSLVLAGFAAVCRAHTFAPGIGLPGCVWASQQPAWIVDVTRDANFSRASSAAKAGLGSAFAFPLRLGSDMLGVIEFFSCERRLPDEELLQMVATLGSQLGQCLERKHAEEALREGEERLHLALQAGDMGTWEWDITTGQVRWSETLEAIHGISPGTFPGTYEAYCSDIHPEDFDRVTAAIATTLADGSDHRIIYRIVLPDGRVRWVEGRGRLFADETGRPVRMSGVCMDISERKLAEDQLKASLREKEVLLREVHHRVKNNLQVISSLLSLQAGFIEEPRVQTLFADCGHRIHSMALIHQSLYQSESLAQIDFRTYLHTLACDLFRTYVIDGERIQLTISADNIPLTIDTAVPCALLAHELVSNCLKHAFPDGQTGHIWITFRREPDGKLQLQVRDNGVGLPDVVTPHTIESFGLQLVDILREQLRATLELERHPGTAVTITFAELTYPEYELTL